MKYRKAYELFADAPEAKCITVAEHESELRRCRAETLREAERIAIGIGDSKPAFAVDVAFKLRRMAEEAEGSDACHVTLSWVNTAGSTYYCDTHKHSWTVPGMSGTALPSQCPIACEANDDA